VARAQRAIVPSSATAASDEQRKGAPQGPSQRARLSLPTFFGKTKKVGQPRQGMKQEMHHQKKKQGTHHKGPFPAAPKNSHQTNQTMPVA
jgi:hypothetical protein